MITIIREGIKKFTGETDWRLLLFLILFLNVKLAVKIVCLLLILLLTIRKSDYREFLKQRFVWFYFSMVLIGLFNFLTNNISSPAIASFLTGVLYWMLALGASFVVYNFVRNNTLEKLHRTISLFFILNISVSIIMLVAIMFETGSLNPYTYLGMQQKYSINTGDYIKGLTFDISTTNALISGFGIFYFIYIKRMLMALACTVSLLLTTSNITIIMVLLVLVIIFIFRSDRIKKSIILVTVLLSVVFFKKISPDNLHYMSHSSTGLVQQNDGTNTEPKKHVKRLLTEDEIKFRIAQRHIDSIYVVQQIAIEKDSVRLKNLWAALQEFRTTDIPRFVLEEEKDAKSKKNIISRILNRKQSDYRSYSESNLPGKLIAYFQTIAFLKDHPSKLITGNGTGNFSSKVAFKVAGMSWAGTYPEEFRYIDPAFRNNHLSVYTHFFSKEDKSYHSVKNAPNSFYNQLLGEYGLLGLLSFVILYLFYFLKDWKKLTYGFALIPVLLLALATDYWFEQLSVTILFELLLLLDIKTMTNQKNYTINK